MKIIYFIDRLSTPGGIERMLTVKANKLSERGYKIVIIATEDGKQKPYFPLDKKVKVFYLNVEKPLSKLQKFSALFKEFYNPQYFQKAVRIVNQEKPDICISLFSTEKQFLYKIKDGSKKIIAFPFSRKGLLNFTKVAKFPRLTEWYFKNIKFKQYDRVAKKYDAFVTLTHQDKEHRRNLKNITVIPNSITFNINENRFLDYAQKTILSVGNIHYYKGFDLLIKAWSILEKKYPDWQLKIIGRRKNTSDNLDEIIVENNLRNVQVLPAVKNIEEEYYKGSIYAGASRCEGFSQVTLEAMSCGLPVVFFDTPVGPSEIITDKEDGYIAEYLNIEDLADKLSLLMDDQDKREKMGRKAKINVQRFNPDNIITQWEKLFNKIVK